MQTEPVVLPTIPAQIPWQAVWRRLGYHRGTDPDPATRDRVAAVGRTASLLAQPKGVYAVLPCISRENSVVINDAYVIQSTAVQSLLKHCPRAAVMAVTIGSAICEERDRRMGIDGKYAEGVILDAIASQLAEAAMAWLHEMITKTALQQGFRVTMRYSPGYKDFHLDNQAMFQQLLAMETIGITVTDSYMLEPEKSVTALAGWERDR